MTDPPHRPHPLVLEIMCDELTISALSFYGRTECQTPNLDRLASLSVQFDSCFVQSPICVPSRASMATGQYSRTHQAMDNSCAPAEGVDSLYECFRKVGYRTATLGKWHVNVPEEDFGWDEAEATPPDGTSVFGVVDVSERTKADYRRLPGNLPLVVSGRHPRQAQATATALLASRAVQWLETNASDASGPLYLRVSFLAPHTPILPPVPYDTMYDKGSLELPTNFRADLAGKPTLQHYYYESRGFGRLKEEDYRAVRAAYFGLVTHVDAEIGRVLDALERSYGLEEAIVVFTSDHGTMLGEHGWIEKWGHFYEPVVRVPLLIHLPGHEAAGRRIRGLAQGTDILPTVLDVLGISSPTGIAGKSHLPVIRNQVSALRDYVVSEWFTGGLLERPCVMIRTSRHKLCLYGGTADLERWLPLDHPARFTNAFAAPIVEGELYDLLEDPREVNNLFSAESHSGTRAELVALLDEWSSTYPLDESLAQLRPRGEPNWLYFQLEQGNLMRRISDLVQHQGTTVRRER